MNGSTNNPHDLPCFGRSRALLSAAIALGHRCSPVLTRVRWHPKVVCSQLGVGTPRAANTLQALQSVMGLAAPGVYMLLSAGVRARWLLKHPQTLALQTQQPVVSKAAAIAVGFASEVR
jgi:hypothetical protein